MLIEAAARGNVSNLPQARADAVEDAADFLREPDASAYFARVSKSPRRHRAERVDKCSRNDDGTGGNHSGSNKGGPSSHQLEHGST